MEAVYIQQITAKRTKVHIITSLKNKIIFITTPPNKIYPYLIRKLTSKK